MANESAKNNEPAEPKPLNMSGVEDRTKGMLEPELIFTAGSYMVEPTALALRRLAEINVDLTRGNGLPGVLALHDVPDDPEDVAAQPVLARADNTIMVRKSPKTGKVRLDMRRFILLRRFVIPHGHRGYVPIVRRTLPKIGDALVFLFSKARFVPIDPQRTKKKKSGGAAEQTKSTPQPEQPKDDAASA
ncbi:MAG: hypothetical protein JWN15_3237 [Firmicutes bacterium]|nr:hypothetical protein [Bacillota bacterium]